MIFYRARSRSTLKFAEFGKELVLSGLVLLTLSSCNATGSQNNNNEDLSDLSGVRQEKLDVVGNPEGLRNIGSPATAEEGFSVDPVNTDYNEALPPPGVMGTPMQPGDLPPLAVKGLQVEKLFTENLSSDDARLDRLEFAVQDIHNYLSAISPSVGKLVTIEQDMQELVGLLQTLVNEDTGQTAPIPPVTQNRGTDAFGSVAVVEDSPFLPPPPARAPETVTPAPVITDKGVPLSQPSSAPQPEIAASPAPRQNPSLPASSDNALVDVRVGVQPDKTRIVFDMTSKLNVENTLDNEISVLSFYIPDGKSLDLSSINVPRSDVLSSGTVTPQDNGVVVAFELKKNASVVDEGYIAPSGGNPYHRYFIDIR